MAKIGEDLLQSSKNYNQQGGSMDPRTHLDTTRVSLGSGRVGN